MRHQGGMWMMAAALMLLCSAAMAGQSTPARKIADEMNSGGSVMAQIAAEMGLSNVDGAGVALAVADGPRRPEARDGGRGDMLSRMKERRREELSEAKREKSRDRGEARDKDRGDHPRVGDRRESDRRQPPRDGERDEAEARRQHEQAIARLERARRELEAKVDELRQAVRKETERLEELQRRGDAMRRGPQSAAPGRGAQGPAFGPDRRQGPAFDQGFNRGQSSGRGRGRDQWSDRDRAFGRSPMTQGPTQPFGPRPGFGPGSHGCQNFGQPCPLAQGRFSQPPLGSRSFGSRSGRGSTMGGRRQGDSSRGRSGWGSWSDRSRSVQGHQAGSGFRGRSGSGFSGGSPMWRGRTSQAAPQTKSRGQQGQASPWSRWGGRGPQAGPQSKRGQQKTQAAPQHGQSDGRESAEGQRRPGGMMMRSPMGMAGPIGKLMSAEVAEKLRLTDEQRDRIHKLVGEYREQLSHMGRRVANAIKDTPADQRREKLREIAGNAKERAGDLSRQLKDKVMDVLTPRQRDSVKKLLAGEQGRPGRETPRASESRGRRSSGRDRDRDDDEDDDD